MDACDTTAGVSFIKEGDSTPVTAADFAIQGLVSQTLRAAFPADRRPRRTIVANPADRHLRSPGRPTRPTAPAARPDRPMRPPNSPTRPRLPWWVASFIGWLISRLGAVAVSLLNCLIGSFIK